MKKTLLIIAGILALFLAVLFGFWTFAHDQTLTALINSPVSHFITLAEQADASEIWPNILTHQNPPAYIDNFDGPELSSAWNIAMLNGQGYVTEPPFIHASNIQIINGELVLSVLHDPDFDQELSTWVPGQAATERYNNAFVVGFAGYSPTDTENIEFTARFRISIDFHGSGGMWIQEGGTVDPQTGLMTKPFRSIGFSHLGLENNTPFDGNQLEAVVGFVPVCTRRIDTTLDQTQYNIYKMIWSLAGEDQMKVDLFINDQFSVSCTFPSFYPGEIQLWADNYLVNDLDLSFQNIPEGTSDQIFFDYVSVEVVKK